MLISANNITTTVTKVEVDLEKATVSIMKIKGTTTKMGYKYLFMNPVDHKVVPFDRLLTVGV